MPRVITDILTFMWRDWFTFTRQDQRAILLLSVLIIAVAALLWTQPLWYDKESYEVYMPDSLQQETMQPKVPIVKISLRPFNPNTADSLELVSVGLPSSVARNIVRYRSAGGVFRKPDDLARIYGLHDTVFQRIRPYIEILQRNDIYHVANQEPVSKPIKTAEHEHPFAEYMRAKNKPGNFVDINRADTTELMKIPGIGPVYAKMIVDYREQLGGFHSIAQLHELGVLPEDIGDWTHVATPHTMKLRINHLSVTRLRSHPYLTFYQAKAIVDLRKREGDIKSIRQLLFLDEFTEKDIERLTPYLTFD